MLENNGRSESSDYGKVSLINKDLGKYLHYTTLHQNIELKTMDQ